MLSAMYLQQKKQRTRAVGVPCENPVPMGCSTNRILERLVQLNSFWVALAWPQDQVMGWASNTKGQGNTKAKTQKQISTLDRVRERIFSAHPVLLKRALERRTAWTAICPDNAQNNQPVLYGPNAGMRHTKISSHPNSPPDRAGKTKRTTEPTPPQPSKNDNMKEKRGTHLARLVRRAADRQ